MFVCVCVWERERMTERVPREITLRWKEGVKNAIYDIKWETLDKVSKQLKSNDYYFTDINAIKIQS